MRSHEQISVIQSRITDPYIVENLLSSFEIEHLVSLYENHPSLIKKNTGPITLDLALCNDDLINTILQRIQKHIGEFEITAGLFFKTDYPHIIHNDDTYELPAGVYKAITIPLKIYGNFTEYPKLCFFDQFYFHGPAKFFNGDSDLPTYFNQCLYDYKDVCGTVDTNITDNEKFLTHLKPQWFKGLSLHSTLPWIPTSAIIFDSVRLHCASDFRQLGITSKLGLSIFTKVK